MPPDTFPDSLERPLDAPHDHRLELFARSELLTLCRALADYAGAPHGAEDQLRAELAGELARRGEDRLH
jgi:hypothetical protein